MVPLLGGLEVFTPGASTQKLGPQESLLLLFFCKVFCPGFVWERGCEKENLRPLQRSVQ